MRNTLYLRFTGYFQYFLELVKSVLPSEKNPPGEYLCEYAADAPNIDRFSIEVGA